MKPKYTPPSTEGIYSPMLAEQVVDEAREDYKQQMKYWWDNLTLEQKKEEWQKDSSQLSFYVQKPINH